MGSINSPMPDPEYSFQVVVFEVGDKTFRVPRHGFDIPGTCFPLPLSRDENTPHRLEVDEGRFRALLHAMFPFVGCQTITTNDWLDALDLATEWKLVEVRNRAINALDSWVETHPAKDVALLAKKYLILSWMKRAYLRLALNRKLTTQELLSSPPLDWETIGRLFAVKDARKSKRCSSFIGCGDRCGCDDAFPSFIEHEFREEFKAVARDCPKTTDNPSRETWQLVL